MDRESEEKYARSKLREDLFTSFFSETLKSLWTSVKLCLLKWKKAKGGKETLEKKKKKKGEDERGCRSQWRSFAYHHAKSTDVH